MKLIIIDDEGKRYELEVDLEFKNNQQHVDFKLWPLEFGCKKCWSNTIGKKIIQQVAH